MKNSFILLFLLLPLFSCSQKPKEQPPVEEIWGKYLSTLGKKESLANVKSLSFSVIDPSDPDGIRFNTHIKYPDKVYMEITGAKLPVAIILNGDRGIERSGEDVRVLSENEMREFKLMALIFPEVHFRQLGYQISLGTDTIVNKMECFNVLLQSEDQSFQYLIDKDTFLLRAIKKQGVVTEITETIMIDDMRFFASSRNTLQDETLIHEAKNYQLNEEIPDSLFTIE